MKKNIAVIGCGHWGKNLVRNFSELGALGAICDPDNVLADKFSELYQVKSLSFSEIISSENIQGIVLAVPAPLHAEMAIKAMDAGKHVYVEKPLAMNDKEASQMIKKSDKMNVKLMVGHLLQYHPVFIKAREIANSGELGTLNYIYSNRLSFGKIRTEEDVIWSFAPHDISMILSLTNKKPVSIKTESSCILQNSIADKATIHIDFESGLKAHISISWFHPFKEQKLVIIGSKGALVFDDTKSWGEKLAKYSYKIDLSNKIPELYKSNVEFINVEESEPLKNECQHFIDTIKSSSKPITDGEEGLSVLKVLTAATLSQKNSKSVKL